LGGLGEEKEEKFGIGSEKLDLDILNIPDTLSRTDIFRCPLFVGAVDSPFGSVADSVSPFIIVCPSPMSESEYFLEDADEGSVPLSGIICRRVRILKDDHSLDLWSEDKVFDNGEDGDSVESSNEDDGCMDGVLDE